MRVNYRNLPEESGGTSEPTTGSKVVKGLVGAAVAVYAAKKIGGGLKKIGEGLKDDKEEDLT